MKCRHCNHALTRNFADLRFSPPSNEYVCMNADLSAEASYPLRVLYCENCWLVQTEDFTSAENLFSHDYAYFSSFSSSWLEHCKAYTNAMIERFELNESSCVVEVAANDGYLLQFFQYNSIPNYGVEPTKSTADAAKEKGLEIVESFFGESLAKKLCQNNKQADLMVANNVLAHVPDINDFVKGFVTLLKPSGVATFEFPHLCALIENNQFDTIYHEHFSYLSFTFINTLFASQGLHIFDVKKISTHGGSLRVFTQRNDSRPHKVTKNVSELLKQESDLGVKDSMYYDGFQTAADKVSTDFKEFILGAKKEGKKIAGYGAAAKGNTLLNYSGIDKEQIDFVVDMNPQKQGKLLPGSHISIVGIEALKENKPDIVVVFPWNLIDEISLQIDFISEWDAKLVIALPEIKVL